MTVSDIPRTNAILIGVVWASVALSSKPGDLAFWAVIATLVLAGAC